METIHYISSDLLSIEMINEIVFQGKQLALSEEAIVNIEKCRKYLDDKMKSVKILDNINIGLYDEEELNKDYVNYISIK